jgi:hypothetical protein
MEPDLRHSLISLKNTNPGHPIFVQMTFMHPQLHQLDKQITSFERHVRKAADNSDKIA